MAENFRKAKIQKYYTSLRIRKSITKAQLENGGPLSIDSPYDERMVAHQKGYLHALELILAELENEFDLFNPDNPESNIDKVAGE